MLLRSPYSFASAIVAVALSCALANAQSPEPLPSTILFVSQAMPNGEEVLAEAVPVPAVPPGFTLEEVTNIAIAESPRLRRAAADIEQARGAAIQAGMAPNPRFESGNPQQLGGNQSVYSAGLQQEIIRGGKLRLSRAEGEQRVASLQMQYQAERLALILEVRRQFIATLAQQMRLDLLRELFALTERSESTTENLMNAGQASRTDILLMRVERRRAESAVQSTDALLLGQKMQLAALIGTPDIGIDRLTGSLGLTIPEMNDEDLVRQVATGNPLVRSAQFEIERNRFALQRAIVEPIPNVMLLGGAQYTLNQPHTQGLVGVNFDIPIWSRNQGGIRAARGELAGSQAQFAVVQNDLSRRLADAQGRYRAADGQLRNFETGIMPEALESMTLVREGYERWQFDILRLLQAQRAYFESQLGYLEAQENRSNAAAEIAGLLQLERMP